MPVYRFNRNPVIVGSTIEQPPADVVKNTPSLWQADLDTAIRYGGELTRAALGVLPIVGDRRNVVVDTKVHMLMPGQCPAIPGWHTDGVPRRIDQPTPGAVGGFHPLGGGYPSLAAQDRWDAEGTVPRFHLLVTGRGCLTQFIRDPLDLVIEDDRRRDLYRDISHLVNNAITRDPSLAWEAPSCTSTTWDWWNLHQGILATWREWRFLIRVTESDYHEPLPPSRLPEIIRTQQMVYTPMEFGW